MFADNMLLFSHGDKASVETLKSCLDKFVIFLGLKANPVKNDCLVSCSNEYLREELILAFSFWKGTLSIRYQGIPLVITKFSYGHYKSILDKV